MMYTMPKNLLSICVNFALATQPVVILAFAPFLAIGGNPANADVTRLCDVSPCPVPDTATALPNQVRYQLRYTRVFNPCHYTAEQDKMHKPPSMFRFLIKAWSIIILRLLVEVQLLLTSARSSIKTAFTPKATNNLNPSK